MKAKCYAAVVGFSIASVFAAKGADGPVAITCQISGVTNVFSVDAKAVHTPRDGLSLFALADPRGKMAAMSLTIPSPRLGTICLRSATNLTLFYSSSVYSSSMEAHYSARSDVPGSTLIVSLEKLGEVGETVAGQFSGVAVDSLGNQVVITNGTFLLVRGISIGTKESAPATQPFDPHEPCEGPRSPR